MATSTYNELISLAEQIRTATAADSNTAELLGGTLKQLIQFVGTLSSDAAVAEGLAEIEAALEEAQSSVSSMETDIQTAVSEAQTAINTAKAAAIEEISEFGGVEVVQETGDSTTAVMSQAAVKSELTWQELSMEGDLPLSEYPEYDGRIDYASISTGGKHLAIPCQEGDQFFIRGDFTSSLRGYWAFGGASYTHELARNILIAPYNQNVIGGNGATITIGTGVTWLIIQTLDQNNNEYAWRLWKIGEDYVPPANGIVFDSAAHIGEDISSDLDISDDDGNVLARFKDGHIITKNFDSRKISEQSKVFNYAYSGERIDIRQNYFSLKDIALLYWEDSSINQYHQGGNVYDKYLFQFHTNGGLCVYDMESNTLLQEIITGISHAGMVQFGNEYHTSGDPFPLMYISAQGNDAGGISVYRISGDEGEWVLTLVQTITVPIDGTNFVKNPYAFIDTFADRLVIVGLAANYSAQLTNTVKVTYTSLPTLSQGDVTLSVSQFSPVLTVAKNRPVPQGGFVRNGKIYIVEGGTSQAHIDVFDYLTGEVVSEINLVQAGYTREPETMFVYNDEIYLIDYYGKLQKLLV